MTRLTKIGIYAVVYALIALAAFSANAAVYQLDGEVGYFTESSSGVGHVRVGWTQAETKLEGRNISGTQEEATVTAWIYHPTLGSDEDLFEIFFDYNGVLAGSVPTDFDASLDDWGEDDYTGLVMIMDSWGTSHFLIPDFDLLTGNLLRISIRDETGSTIANTRDGFDYVNAGLPTSTSPTPVPVPATIWLFGTGLVGLIGFARKRKTSEI